MEMTATCLACLFLAQIGSRVEPAQLSQEARVAAAVPMIHVPEKVPGDDARTFTATQLANTQPETTQPETTQPVYQQIGNKRLSPPEMVAEAMALPVPGKLTGQPITLLQALSTAPDRRRQLDVTRAYWRLAQALAENRFCTMHAEQVAAMHVRGNAATARMATATAAAMVREAELEATNAQYDLAALLSMPPDTALPLPADRPHVGAYRTNFQELFAGRVPPERTRLMDRVLPIWRQAVDERASAVQAAEDVFLAVAEEQAAGQGDASLAVASSEKLLQERRAFIRVVCDYNRDIAEYGLTVAAPGAAPQAIVAMLIDARPETAPTMAANQPDVGSGNASGVQPTGLNEPVPMSGAQPSRRRPTPAQPPAGARPNEPTLAPPRGSLNLNEQQDDSIPDATPAMMPPADVRERPLAAPETSLLTAPTDGRRANGTNLVPVKTPAAISDLELPDADMFRTAPSDPKSVTTHKPAVATPGSMDATSAASPSVVGFAPLYAGLLDADPAVRAKQLTVALHWDRTLPENTGKPLKLADSLTRSVTGDQRGTIEVYWRVRQRAAQYQVLLQQVEWLDAMTSLLLERRSEPTGPIEMLHLRAAHLAAKAAVREAHIGLIAAQHELAGRTGVSADAVWPLAVTPPHSGKYLLKLDVQPANVASSWAVRRLATVIPSLGDGVQQRATAVIDADAVRSAAVEQYRAGGESIGQVLESVRRQTQESIVFLETLTQYNLAIADYAMTVLPPGTPADRLAASLVVKP